MKRNVVLCESKLGIDSRIKNCNGKNACGDPNFVAAVCYEAGGSGAVVEAPFVSWDYIMNKGYWCMPCCILEENNHSKMKTCSQIPTEELIRRHHNIHGRCGIEFHP